jgi:hypothetical protein
MASPSSTTEVCPQSVERLGYERIFPAPVIALLGVQAHAAVHLPRHEPVAVVLDFMNPLLARGSFHRPGGKAGHIGTRRVDSLWRPSRQHTPAYARATIAWDLAIRSQSRAFLS